MKKRDFNLVGNEGTDNQELAKGIAFVKSRRAELNVVQMVESMRDQAMWTGGDTSITGTAAHPKDKADTGRTDSGAELCSALWCVVQAGDWR